MTSGLLHSVRVILPTVSGLATPDALGAPAAGQNRPIGLFPQDISVGPSAIQAAANGPSSRLRVATQGKTADRQHGHRRLP